MNQLTFLMAGVSIGLLVLVVATVLRLRKVQTRLAATANELELEHQARVLDARELQRLRDENAVLGIRIRELSRHER